MDNDIETDVLPYLSKEDRTRKLLVANPGEFDGGFLISMTDPTNKSAPVGLFWIASERCIADALTLAQIGNPNLVISMVCPTLYCTVSALWDRMGREGMCVAGTNDTRRRWFAASDFTTQIIDFHRGHSISDWFSEWHNDIGMERYVLTCERDEALGMSAAA
jgi:hypothetical protein